MLCQKGRPLIREIVLKTFAEGSDMRAVFIPLSLFVVVKPLRMLQKIHTRQNLSFMKKLASKKWKIMNLLFAKKKWKYTCTYIQNKYIEYIWYIWYTYVTYTFIYLGDAIK